MGVPAGPLKPATAGATSAAAGSVCPSSAQHTPSCAGGQQGESLPLPLLPKPFWCLMVSLQPAGFEARAQAAQSRWTNTKLGWPRCVSCDAALRRMLHAEQGGARQGAFEVAQPCARLAAIGCLVGSTSTAPVPRPSLLLQPTWGWMRQLA